MLAWRKLSYLENVCRSSLFILFICFLEKLLFYKLLFLILFVHGYIDLVILPWGWQYDSQVIPHLEDQSIKKGTERLTILVRWMYEKPYSYISSIASKFMNFSLSMIWILPPASGLAKLPLDNTSKPSSPSSRMPLTSSYTFSPLFSSNFIDEFLPLLEDTPFLLDLSQSLARWYSYFLETLFYEHHIRFESVMRGFLYLYEWILLVSHSFLTESVW